MNTGSAKTGNDDGSSCGIWIYSNDALYESGLRSSKASIVGCNWWNYFFNSSYSSRFANRDLGVRVENERTCSSLVA